MKEAIQHYLTNLEREENIRILLAAESGSRAWGFPSADSDFDVRIIYVHAPEWYFSISRKKDSIEYLSADRMFDLSGWDLRKALTLMSKTNPSFSDWLFSGIIYRENREFTNRLRQLHDIYYNPLHAAHHYASQARNFRAALSSGSETPLKKLLYFLRALFNAEYIIKSCKHPPVEFISTVGALPVPDNIRQLLTELISAKSVLTEKDATHVDRQLLEFAEMRYDRLTQSLDRFRPAWNHPADGLQPLDAMIADTIR